ncbi:MAG: HIT domain-containing protein [Candidatus Omnitrophota bacterium]
MTIKRLWAPWRIKYIKSKKQKGCIFCKSLRAKGGDYVVLKNKYSFALLNIFPYNNGHVLVSPVRHIRDLSQLKDTEVMDLFGTLKKTKRLLDKVLKPDGYNIGINTSKSAGAGETGHMHIHIVPRWKGDTNFITTLSETKIISQSLDELYKQLRKAC